MKKLPPPGYKYYDGLILPSAVVDEAMARYDVRVTDATHAEQARLKLEEDQQGSAVGADAAWPVPAEGSPGLSFKIFDKQQVIDFKPAGVSAVQGRDEAARARALLRLLESKGEYRLLATLPADWHADLCRLEQEFPNFVEVIDYLRVACALASRTEGVLHICMLLSGPAGTGKSMFAQVIGEWIGGGYSCIRYESAQSAADLAGSSNFWSNTAPGRPFTMLTEGQYANPTFFLDEIDKVSAVQYDPLGAFYALLEPATARTHADLSWPFLHLDCSRINYVAACNEPRNIPAPILSRLRRFDIPEPTPEQALIIANKIIGEEQNRHAVQVGFSDAAVDALCRLAPRRMRQIVQEALGRALLHERNMVQVEDFPAREKPRHGIGFLG